MIRSSDSSAEFNQSVVFDPEADVSPDLNATIKELIDTHAGLPVGGAEVGEDQDLYRAGMKSFASVQLMLALEETFDIEFPDTMLTRATFRSRAAIEQAVQELISSSRAAS
jgi:acyl carrier protein